MTAKYDWYKQRKLELPDTSLVGLEEACATNPIKLTCLLSQLMIQDVIELAGLERDSAPTLNEEMFLKVLAADALNLAFSVGARDEFRWRESAQDFKLMPFVRDMLSSSWDRTTYRLEPSLLAATEAVLAIALARQWRGESYAADTPLRTTHRPGGTNEEPGRPGSDVGDEESKDAGQEGGENEDGQGGSQAGKDGEEGVDGGKGEDADGEGEREAESTGGAGASGTDQRSGGGGSEDGGQGDVMALAQVAAANLMSSDTPMRIRAFNTLRRCYTASHGHMRTGPVDTALAQALLRSNTELMMQIIDELGRLDKTYLPELVSYQEGRTQHGDTLAFGRNPLRIPPTEWALGRVAPKLLAARIAEGGVQNVHSYGRLPSRRGPLYIWVDESGSMDSVLGDSDQPPRITRIVWAKAIAFWIARNCLEEDRPFILAGHSEDGGWPAFRFVDCYEPRPIEKAWREVMQWTAIKMGGGTGKDIPIHAMPRLAEEGHPLFTEERLRDSGVVMITDVVWRGMNLPRPYHELCKEFGQFCQKYDLDVVVVDVEQQTAKDLKAMAFARCALVWSRQAEREIVQLLSERL